MTTIKIGDKDILIEITSRCYTGCKAYCYKKNTVGPRGIHVPFETIKSRILWAKKHTNGAKVYLLGGEPLLHPDFIKICEFIKSLNLEVCMITSGKVSNLKHEQQNYTYVLEEWVKGLLYLELSYHQGLNEKEYASMIKFFRANFEKRREALKKLNRYNPTSFDVFTTAVIANPGHTKKSLEKFANEAIMNVDWTIEEHLNQMWEGYKKHFTFKTKQLNIQIHSLDEWTGFRFKINFVGEKKITYQGQSVKVSVPEGGTCGAIDSNIYDDYIYISDIIIRVDGGMSFARAMCVDMKSPLLNVDQHKSTKSILSALGGSLRQIKSLVFLHNRLKAKNNCDKNGKEIDCTDCPFDQMCTPCWESIRPWQSN